MIGPDRDLHLGPIVLDRWGRGPLGFRAIPTVPAAALTFFGAKKVASLSRNRLVRRLEVIDR